MPLQNDADIKRLLEESKTIAVVGWSNKPGRPSGEVAAMLESVGYEIYPVNPAVKGAEVTVYPTLADVPVPIDVVDVFRRAEDVPEVVEAAIAAGAKAIWIQLGIVNHDAARRAEEAGLTVVMDRCMKIEYNRLMR